MKKYSRFSKLINENVTIFKNLIKGKTVRLISHLDSDGICAASIMIKALIRENINYSISIIPQLREEVLKEIENEKYDIFIFTDLGSGQKSLINKYLLDKIVFILDHHELDNNEVNNKNLFEINPHLVGIDGSSEISGSGVVYKFVEKLNLSNQDLSHIAIIGAMGDVQENNGFKFLNNEILKTAIDKKKINAEKGLKIFGLETKPLYKVLSFSTDPIIPDINGNENNAINFLKNIGVNPYIGTKARKFFNLNEEEKEKLISALIIKTSSKSNDNKVIGNVYYLNNEEKGSHTRDIREFSTLLNACGRLNRSSLGIGACLNDLKMKEKAVNTLLDYKKEIMNTLKWYDKNKSNPDKIIRGNGFIIMKPKNEILNTMIGTLSSIVSRNRDVAPNTYIMSLANLDEYSIKVSIRIANDDKTFNLDVKSLLDEIIKIVGGQSGGHKNAAGAIISVEIEKEFVNTAIKIFNEKYDANLIVQEVESK